VKEKEMLEEQEKGEGIKKDDMKREARITGESKNSN
jgi:hypothetical protein